VRRRAGIFVAAVGMMVGGCAGTAAADPVRSVGPLPAVSILKRSDPYEVRSSRRPPRPSPVPALRPRRAAGPVASSDGDCLRALERRRILFVPLGPVRGVRTPVVIVGPIRGVNLLPRAGRPAVMDCQLAQALTDAAPIFQQLHVTGLSFSGAYDYRKRRGSSDLSAHAHGLAIDVHVVETTAGTFEVERDYPRDARRWREGERGAGPWPLRDCLGEPASRGGRVLRTLACRLKSHPDFRVVLTPDDNADHHDHLHIETYPGPYVAPPRPSPVATAATLPRGGGNGRARRVDDRPPSASCRSTRAGQRPACGGGRSPC
jgi:hypothetical protein